ncbi:MAG: hypothetical protein KAR44_09055 [Candidatus Aegiribacteria sp.]|nr:hypothetical protein [Candidatus Aegiribacteria sp.]
MLKYCILVLFLSGLATALSPIWKTEYQLVNNGSIIDVGYYAAPYVEECPLTAAPTLPLSSADRNP